MAWIETILPPNATGRLSDVYDQVAGSRGKVSNILSIHSLLPETMQTHMDLYLSIMFKKTGLTRLQRELIATAVSVSNRCDYCENHHAEALRAYMDADQVEAFVGDLSGFELPDEDRALVDYAIALTTRPGDAAEAWLEPLRDAGFDDSQVLAANLVVGYFNFVNRIAVGLGVVFTPEEMTGYKY